MNRHAARRDSRNSKNERSRAHNRFDRDAGNRQDFRQKIAAVELPAYLPAGDPIQGKAGGVFVERRAEPQRMVAERRDEYGEALIAAKN
jgi:hypothetical protein